MARQKTKCYLCILSDIYSGVALCKGQLGQKEQTEEEASLISGYVTQTYRYMCIAKTMARAPVSIDLIVLEKKTMGTQSVIM